MQHTLTKRILKTIPDQLKLFLQSFCFEMFSMGIKIPTSTALITNKCHMTNLHSLLTCVIYVQLRANQTTCKGCLVS